MKPKVQEKMKKKKQPSEHRTSKFVDLTQMQEKLKNKTETNSTTTTTKKQEPTKEAPKGPTKGLDKVFEDYKNYSLQEDPEESNDAVLRGPGILKYAEDLGINLENDPALILIAWKLQINQEHVWEIGSAEFLGWEKLGCKSIDDMKKKVDQWKKGN